MRRAAKVDANHTAIVDALRKLGCSVQSLAAIGQGCPDLLVAVNGHNFLIEVKDGSKPPSERRLTSDQKRWHAAWNGPAHLVETVDRAIQLVAYYRQRSAA